MHTITITSDNIDFIKSLEYLSKNAGAIFKIFC